MADKLRTTVFNGVEPRAVALILARADVEANEQPAFWRGNVISDKICIERIPDSNLPLSPMEVIDCFDLLPCKPIDGN